MKWRAPALEGLDDDHATAATGKVADRAVVLDHSETFAVERQAPRQWPGVVDHHAVRLGLASRTRHAGRWIVSEIDRSFRHRREIVENTLHVREAIDDVRRKGHSEFLLVYGGLRVNSAKRRPNAGHHFSSHGRSTISNAQVDR